MESLKTVTENLVKLVLPADKKAGELVKFYNPNLSIFREAVLCTLEIEAKTSERPFFLCLDAVAGSGLVSIQWKKHLEDLVLIIASDRKLDDIRSACEINEITCSDWLLTSNRKIGELPTIQQKADEIHISGFPANIVLHYDAFSFVYVQPNGDISSYIDPVLTNIRGNGVACFVTPNIASQCFRSPKLIQRQYGAHVIKTEYVKEMAVRVVLAEIARSAAKHCRGVEVLYTLCAKDQCLIVVKVTRSTQHAIQCVEMCRQVLHCLMCEERVVCPDTSSPIEQPYSQLPCDCKAKNPGKTAVILGPMWTGNIFNTQFLEKLVSGTKTRFPKSKLISLLESLLTESKCEGSEGLNKLTNENDPNKRATNQDNPNKNQTNQNSHNDSTNQNCDEPALKRQKLENEQNQKNMDNKSQNNCSDEVNTSDINLNQTVDGCSESKTTDTCETYKSTPLFYYDLHRQKLPGLPKSDELVTLLQQEGYRASRTHFEWNGIRTNATAKQIHNVVIEYNKNK